MFGKRLSRAIAVSAATTLVLTAVALADQQVVDNDTASSGLQNSVSLSAAPGATVNASAQLVIEYQGGNHLAVGTEVTLAVVAAQTDLPAGYSASSVALTIPNPWSSGGKVAGTSNISFTAPAAPGPYTYAVKWESTVDYGNQLTGAPAFTINLTVEEPEGCDNYYVADFLKPFDGSNPANLINNLVKNGRTVPVKVEIFEVDCITDLRIGEVESGLVTHTTGAVKARATNDAVESYADAGASSGNSNQFRWSSTDGFWIFNLNTKDLSLDVNQSYEIHLFLNGTAIDDAYGLFTPVK